MMTLKEDMSGIKFQSRWFERCLKDFLGIRERSITSEDVREIKYLFVSTTHSYEMGFAKSLPPELFLTCAFQDAGDEWETECIKDTGKYRAADEFLKFGTLNLKIDHQVRTIRLKEKIERFEADPSMESYRVMKDFKKSVRKYGTQDCDFDGLEEDEITCDYGILVPEDISRLTSLEVLRLMSCQTEIHSLRFLEDLPELRILEIGEVFLNDLEGLEKLIGLEKLCIWSN